MSTPNASPEPASDGETNLIATDDDVGPDNIEPQLCPFGVGVHQPVFAIYAVTIVALALARFSYNQGLPLTTGSMLYLMFGGRVWGPRGHVIDIRFAVVLLIGCYAIVLGLWSEPR